MARLISVDAFIAKCKARENAKNDVYVKEIMKFFDAGIDDLKLQTLAIYIDALDPRKRQIFADEWSSLQAERQATEPSLETPKDTHGSEAAPEPPESA